MEVRDHIHTPTAIPSSSLSRRIILMILDSKFHVPNTSLFLFIIAIKWKTVIYWESWNFPYFWNTLHIKFQNEMSNNSVRSDILRGCLVSFVGGEKLMIEGENNLYGSEAPDGWHSYWSTGDLSLSLTVFLLDRFHWRLTWLSECSKAQSKHRVTRPTVWQWFSLPRICVVSFNLGVTEIRLERLYIPENLQLRNPRCE